MKLVFILFSFVSEALAKVQFSSFYDTGFGLQGDFADEMTVPGDCSTTDDLVVAASEVAQSVRFMFPLAPEKSYLYSDPGLVQDPVRLKY